MAYTLKVKFSEDIDIDVKNYYNSFNPYYANDSGVDIVVPTDVVITKNQVGTLNHQIQCEMVDENGNNVSYYLYPRSSISKTPLIMANSVGIIDGGYRGDIMAKVWIVDNNIQEYNVKANTKLFQICSPNLSPLKVLVVNELSSSERGDKGFGSTNKN